MLFNSIHYLIFLPIVVSLYFLTPHRWRWLLLLVASYYFYMCWKPQYAILLLISTGVAYSAGMALARTEKGRARKALVWSSISVLLGILFAFKYFNFATASLRAIFPELKLPALDVLLPIGISFYTFQKIAYIVDVYRGKATCEKHFGVFALYSCFFPQLVAGPIERPAHLLPQFWQKHEFDHERITSGLRLILWGFFKKVVVADRLAVMVKTVYADPHSYLGLPLIAATLFFAFQIYCDFSGYTDIAIGSARLLGFDLMQNFRQPYFAKSVQEFWRRWHISLSTWFKDYVYIPLGGNRVPKMHWYYNMFITFVLSGLWHGANWTFAAWGVLHGCYMVIDSIIGPGRDRFRASLKSNVGQMVFDGINMAVTFGLVTVAWIPFRAANFSDAWYVFTNLFAGASHWVNLRNDALQFRGLGLHPVDLVYSILFIGVVVFYDFLDANFGVWELLRPRSLTVRWAVYYSVLVLILFFTPYNKAQNFIYFQF
ncbi:MAG TPA: MBOAT family O-acyltransferase [Verrucomicrobiae bacterium]|nr:MBOAT family O-acyltransferase [Verrucomicrobiae bacterium]